MKKKLTVRDLLDGKGKRQFTEVFTGDAEEARACEAAGLDMLVTGENTAETIRAAAPDTFLTVGCFGAISYSDADAVRVATGAMASGGDAVYTGACLDRVRAIAGEHIPVVGHVGFVPYRRTWYGGVRAIGKTADEALQVYRETLAYQEAGAIAVEMEIVPHRVAAEISKRVDILVISMGSGSGGDAQYLFATDILGTNRGHVPRHAKVYADLKTEYDRLQKLRVDAFSAFHADVTGGGYPEDRHTLAIEDREFEQFLEGIG